MISTFLFNNDRQDNTVIAATQLVNALKIEISESEIKRKLKWSPTYPSINSIQSYLKQWNVETLVLDVDKKNINDLPAVFLCYLQNEKDSFKVVTSHNNESVQWLDKNNNHITISKEEFFEKWSGIVLLAEKQENSGMPDYKKVRQAEWWENFFIPAIVVVLFIVTMGNYFLQSNNSTTALLATIALQLTNATGIIICVGLLRYLVDDTDDAIKKICNTSNDANDCTKIINAVDAKVFGISWAEIGLLWFFGSAIFLATIGLNSTSGLFAITAILFVPYSIYYQRKIARQWCIICLYILFIIITQAIVFLYLFEVGILTTSMIAFFQHIFNAAISIAIPAICWLSIKRFVFNRKALLLAEQDYFRLKHNPKVYEMLQTNNITVDTTTGSPVFFNSDQHDFEITMVSSLICAPCGEAHKMLEKVIKSNPGVCFKLYILPLPDPTYNTLQHLKILLTILEEEGAESFLEALHYWYHIANRDCKKFFSKYPEKNFSAAVEQKIIEMGDWIYGYQLTTTPGYFVNGKAMPDTYGIEDILVMVSNFL